MWEQNYQPIADSLGMSAIVAVIPIVVLFVMLGALRKPAWMSAMAALASAFVIALAAYGMPVQLTVMSTLFGAAFGLFPIAWIVFSSILLYRLAVDTGKFEIIKSSIGGLTDDRRLQALFIAFSFGAFIEGAAGFGAPVAVSGAMLAGLGFNPFYAAGICLLANTAPVAFGSIGTPVITLANVTMLDKLALSSMIGRLCAMISIIIPAYLMIVMVGRKKAAGVLPAIVACGVSFAGVQFYVSNYWGPELTDIMSSLTCIVVMVLVLKLWKPREIIRLEGDKPITVALKKHAPAQVFMAWLPYLLLVVAVLTFGDATIKAKVNTWTDGFMPDSVRAQPVTQPTATGRLNRIAVPGLHNMITQVAPVVPKKTPYAALFELNWLTASGTACFLAAIAAALCLGVGPRKFGGIYLATFKQLSKAILTIALMLGLAYLMNYSGMTSTLGLSLAATGKLFPFFSAFVGWLGVFLTGSDTSANALFGNLQVVTANALSLNPVLTASVNSAAGVMGKMISIQSIAVAVAATGMTSADESRLFRFTIKHSILLMLVMGLLSMMFAYVFPQYVPIIPPNERIPEEGMSADFRFNAMYFLPYIHLPRNHKKFKSTWVDFPNKFYDPEKGYKLYKRYLKELILADRLGFDAIVVNEHHNTVYSMMATPNIIAAAVLPQIKKAKICVWGVPPNFMLPNRLAEEYAILDVMSKGRLEVAFPLGTGMEYWSNPVNPATAREKFKESLKIILQAWKEDGPTTHYGKYYTYRFLNPWPRPYQKPHPPCYIVGTGSPETIEIAAELGFGYSSVFVPQERTYELNAKLRDRAAHFGHTMRPEQLPLLTYVYVAETQEKAEKEYIVHLQRFFEDYARSTPQWLNPPGYVSTEQLKIRAAGADKLHGGFDFDAVSKSFFVAVGTPEKVANQLGEWAIKAGTNHFNNVMHVADMPHSKTVQNLSLFANEVMPRLRSTGGAQ